MASKKGSVKVAYDFSLDAKRKLALLKAELRYMGLPATETGILEALLSEVDPKRVATLYKRYLGR